MPIDAQMRRPFKYKGLLISLTMFLALSGCANEPISENKPVPSPSLSQTPVSAPPSKLKYPVLTKSTPTRVSIPSIGVDSELIELGLNADNSMEVPSEGFPAGWFTGAPTPGELGPAIIAGHVDWTTGPAVFYDLHLLAVGDEITVDREDGARVIFEVMSVEQFSKEDFPTQRVYENLNYSGLRVITCGGKFDKATGHYVDNIVVFAKLKI